MLICKFWCIVGVVRALTEEFGSIVMATGYEKPSIDMLPHYLFPVEGERNYKRPNLYLQVGLSSLKVFTSPHWRSSNPCSRISVRKIGQFCWRMQATKMLSELLEIGWAPSASKPWKHLFNLSSHRPAHLPLRPYSCIIPSRSLLSSHADRHEIMGRPDQLDQKCSFCRRERKNEWIGFLHVSWIVRVDG